MKRLDETTEKFTYYILYSLLLPHDLTDKYVYSVYSHLLTKVLIKNRRIQCWDSSANCMQKIFIISWRLFFRITVHTSLSHTDLYKHTTLLFDWPLETGRNWQKSEIQKEKSCLRLSYILSLCWCSSNIIHSIFRDYTAAARHSPPWSCSISLFRSADKQTSRHLYACQTIIIIIIKNNLF